MIPVITEAQLLRFVQIVAFSLQLNFISFNLCILFLGRIGHCISSKVKACLIPKDRGRSPIYYISGNLPLDTNILVISFLTSICTVQSILII